MDITIIQIILETLLVALGIYLAFFKSYFSEKGKNLATLEDINAITNKVEAIKAEFQISTSTITIINQEKRNSYLALFDKYFIWLNSLTDNYNGGTDDSDNNQINKYITQLALLNLDFSNAEHRMELWNDNLELSQLIGELRVKTINTLSRDKFTYLIELKHKNIQITSAIENKQNTKPLYDETIALYEAYSKKLIESYDKIVPLTRNFINKSREYLLSIK